MEVTIYGVTYSGNPEKVTELTNAMKGAPVSGTSVNKARFLAKKLKLRIVRTVKPGG